MFFSTEIVRQKGLENITVDDLVAEITPKGRGLKADFIYVIVCLDLFGIYMSLVFYCCEQVYDIYMSCLGVILQVMGRDGMSTLQNSTAAYSVSRITYLPGWFAVAFPAVFIFLGVLLLW